MEIEVGRPHDTLISSNPEQTHVIGIYRDSGAIEFKIPGAHMDATQNFRNPRFSKSFN